MKSKNTICVGPSSQHHGEAKIFNFTCDVLKLNSNVKIIDHTKLKNRTISHIISLLILIFNYPVADYIYLSIPRRKYLLSLYLLILLCMKYSPFSKVRGKVLFHVHGYELATAYSGFMSNLLLRIYESAIDTTIISADELKYGSLPSVRVNYEILPNAVEIELSDISQVDMSDYYAFVSFPSFNKRLDKVIKIFEGHPDENLVVIGWKQDDVKKIYGRNFKIPENIVFKGRLDQSHTLAYIRSAIGLIADSEIEAMPLIIAEAILLKTPCYLGSATGYQYYLSNFPSIMRIDQIFLCTPSPENIIKSYEMGKNNFSKKKYVSRLLQIFNE